MKKKLYLLLLIGLIIVLAGCSAASKKESQEDSIKEEIEELEETESENEEIELYSDDTKIVFQSDQIRYVFYYKKNEITAYHVYIDYDTKETAAYALTLLGAEDDETIDKAYNKGRYVVIEYNEKEYMDMTVEELKEAYGSMKEVTK